MRDELYGLERKQGGSERNNVRDRAGARQVWTELRVREEKDSEAAARWVRY